MALTKTTSTFSTMLNEYLPNELLAEEFVKRDYLLSKVEKDNSWQGGDLIVPFEGAYASSVSFGSLTAAADISEDAFVRGKISGQPEVWGSMIFNQRDLMEHGKVSNQNFLKVLPNRLDNFMNYMKMVCSVNMLGGPHFATATGDGGADGTITVDHVDRFTIGQKVVLDDGDSNQANFYVTAIDVNASDITLSATRGGAAANISAYTTAQGAKFYHDGVLVTGTATNMFTSLRSALLSLANGGSTSLHGQSKLAYPYLQAVNILGSAITAANILEKLFDAYVTIKTKCKGNANTVLMSYKHLGSIMKVLEDTKSPFKVKPDSTSASVYGWTEIEIFSVAGKGALKIVGIQEMDDDVIFFIDWSALKFYSNGFFKKRQSPDGKEYFEVRATTGYQYIVDICLFGDLALLKPGNCGVIYSISY